MLRWSPGLPSEPSSSVQEAFFYVITKTGERVEPINDPPDLTIFLNNMIMSAFLPGFNTISRKKTELLR
jgi:hypothetical protein